MGALNIGIEELFLANPHAAPQQNWRTEMSAKVMSKFDTFVMAFAVVLAAAPMLGIAARALLV